MRGQEVAVGERVWYIVGMRSYKSGKAGWLGSGLADWVEGDTAYISVVFSWKLGQAYERAIWYREQGYRVRAGGPAVVINPSPVNEVAEVGGSVDALWRHNPDAVYTTRGCVRKCPFCAVPVIEGDLVELPDDQWEPRKVLCDNNVLASSREHFDRVIDRYLEANMSGVDFNGGLDARLLNEYHATRLAEMRSPVLRLAWDNIGTEKQYRRAHDLLRNAGIKGRKSIRVYILVGFTDTPEDAVYRAQTVQDLGDLPIPMRYQPINAKRKNEYLSENWNEYQLRDFMHYWSSMAISMTIPFEKYSHGKYNANDPMRHITRSQLELPLK